MVYYVQTKRSSTTNKRPLPVELLDGQLAVNFDTSTAGVFFKNNTGGICKVGPTAIGANAPAPTEGGATQLGVGEMWLDTSNISVNTLKIWNGTTWVGVGPTSNASGDVTVGLWTQQNFNIFPTNAQTQIYSKPGIKVGGTTDNPKLTIQGSTGDLTTLGNVTTGDLNLNSTHRTTGNEIDGTKGHWSILEGSDNLYLVNRLNGLKFKFVLSEVQ